MWSRAIPPAFGEKKSGELWSTNNTLLQALSGPPKSTFSEDHILAPMGALPAQIFTRAREWPRLGSAHPTGDGVPNNF